MRFRRCKVVSSQELGIGSMARFLGERYPASLANWDTRPGVTPQAAAISRPVSPDSSRSATISPVNPLAIVTSVLQLFFEFVSDLQKVLSLGPQKVDASAAHLATLVGRGDELAVEIKKHFPPLHHRVVYTQLGVDLDLDLILTDAFATSH